MARNHIGRVQRLEPGVPGLEPVGGVGVFEDRQKAFVERHVAGDHQALVREPDRNIAGRMGRSKIKNLDPEISHFDNVLVLEGDRRAGEVAAFGLVTVVALHAFEDLGPVLLELGGGIDMGQDVHTLFRPIGVAEHRVPLAVLVYHQLYRLIGDGPDFGMERLCQYIGCARVDHHDTVTGDDEAQVVVMAGVFIGGRSCRADGGPDMGDHLHRFLIERRARVLIRYVLAGEGGACCQQESGQPTHQASSGMNLKPSPSRAIRPMPPFGR